MRAHLEHLAGVFRADGWRVHEGAKLPAAAASGDHPGDPLVAVLDDPWIEALPVVARALGSAVPRGGPGSGAGEPFWRVSRLRGAQGAQGWEPRRGPYTLSAVRKLAVARGVLDTQVPAPGETLDPSFAVAAPGDTATLLETGWPPAPERLRLVPGARLYRYDDPADHERRELDPWIPEDARVVVDVGCGHGRLGERLRRPGRRVIGIEPDPEMARRAGQRLDRVLAAGAEEALPALDGTSDTPVDCFVFADVLEHLFEPERAVRLAAERLSPEGRIVVSVPNTAWAPVLRDLVAGCWEPTLAGVQARDHLRPFTRDAIRRLAEEHGLEVESCVPLAAPLPWTTRLWARLVAWSVGGRYDDLAPPQWIAVLRRSRAAQR